MRWSVRYQILVPLFLLLLGLVGICAWTAQDSARLARRRIANQVGDVIRTLSEGQFPLNRHVLEQMKGLSGAEYERLRAALALTMSIDAIVVMRDVCRIDNDAELLEVLRWTATAVLRAGLQPQR